MMNSRQILSGLLGIMMCLAFLPQNADAKPGSPGKVATARGAVTIQDQVAIVEVIVAIQPGDPDPQGKANAALKRLYPEAVPAPYALNGLVWDVFSDGDPSNDKVVVNYNPKNVPDNIGDAGLVCMLQAMSAWNLVPSSTFVFEFGETTDREPSLVKESKGQQFFDGNNDVAWLDIRDPAVLGVTWYGLSTDEFDIAIDNKNFTWFAGDPGLIGPGAYDLQTVYTHEFGHTVGLDHSDVAGSLMGPYYDGVQRELGQDDIDGITALYPAEGADVPPAVIITAPADGASFDIGTSIAFAGTASDEDEILDSVIQWNSDLDGLLGTGASISAVLSLGTHVITAQAVDAEGRTGSDAITVIVRDPSAEPTASVASITYATTGGKNQDRDLLATVAVVDDTGQPVVGAAVAIRITNDGGGAWIGNALTGDSGTVTFKLKNAPAGTYTTEVTDLAAAGLTWDGINPPNGFTK